MRILVLLCFIFWTAVISAQKVEYEIKISDVDNEIPMLYYLKIDDSVYVSIGTDDFFNDLCRFKVILPEGKHRVQGEVYRYELLDTIVMFSPANRTIDLSVDMIKDFCLYEFKEGFSKTYGLDPVIGLRNDGTFLRKSFLHANGAACFQFEEGRYRIDGEMLILDVNKYKCPCNGLSGQMYHRYIFTLKDGQITDPNKYNGFIEHKLYRTKEPEI